jgi:hypothetical protein
MNFHFFKVQARALLLKGLYNQESLVQSAEAAHEKRKDTDNVLVTVEES